MNEQTSSDQISRRQLLHRIIAAVCGSSVLSGCSLGVMFGKMIGGDPLVDCDFKNQTKEDLTKGKSTVLVICSAPDSVDSDYSTLSYDLIDGITRKLKLHGVKVINPDAVASWIDEHGTAQAHPVRLAKDFDTDYIIFIEIHSFSYEEPNSPKMLRGQASGFIRAFEIDEIDGRPHSQTVFVNNFRSTYPEHQPVQEQGHSKLIFEREYLERVCRELAENFYDHRPDTNI